ncbi:MAG: DUF3299 domain-containing protein [Pirellulaceae bacterium]|nr:DUF3299 domain-containing protein [Pirellulaceae bacterium]
MSAAEISPTAAAASPTSDGELHPYRAISRSAVIAFVLSLLGLVLLGLTLVSFTTRQGDAGPVGIWTAILGLMGLPLGIAAWVSIRRYPLEFTGAPLAKFAVAACLAQVGLGLFAAIYTYATEVPEGYERISFYDLQPDPDVPELPVSPLSIEKSGQKVFIKGYMHPAVATSGEVNHFILVNDLGTCCFGGQPKPTHMIEVHIPEGKRRVAYSQSTLKLAGTFAVSRTPGQSMGLSGVWYHLQVDEVR